MVSHALNPHVHSAEQSLTLLLWSLENIVALGSCPARNDSANLHTCRLSLILGDTELDVVNLVCATDLTEVEDDTVGILITWSE